MAKRQQAQSLELQAIDRWLKRQDQATARLVQQLGPVLAQQVRETYLALVVPALERMLEQMQETVAPRCLKEFQLMAERAVFRFEDWNAPDLGAVRLTAAEQLADRAVQETALVTAILAQWQAQETQPAPEA
jgi:hypothetical protein